MTKLAATSLIMLALVGCGDGGSEGAVPTAQVPAPWSKYCIATFTADYQVINVFGDPELSIAKGEAFLLGDYGGGFSDNKASILLLSEGGPIDFTIEVDEGQPFPFESNCEPDDTESYVGVFQDVTLYTDSALTDEACTLSKGQVLEASDFGYELISEDVFIEHPVYEVSSSSLAKLCGGINIGYLEANNVSLGGTVYTVVPMTSFLGPL